MNMENHSITLNFTKEDIIVILESLRNRENLMFQQAEAYKNAGNKEAQMDCLKEWHLAEAVKEKLIEQGYKTKTEE